MHDVVGHGQIRTGPKRLEDVTRVTDIGACKFDTFKEVVPTTWRGACLHVKEYLFAPVCQAVHDTLTVGSSSANDLSAPEQGSGNESHSVSGNEGPSPG